MSPQRRAQVSDVAWWQKSLTDEFSLSQISPKVRRNEPYSFQPAVRQLDQFADHSAGGVGDGILVQTRCRRVSLGFWGEGPDGGKRLTANGKRPGRQMSRRSR